jgi:hypothetical protein
MRSQTERTSFAAVTGDKKDRGHIHGLVSGLLQKAELFHRRESLAKRSRAAWLS